MRRRCILEALQVKNGHIVKKVRRVNLVLKGKKNVLVIFVQRRLQEVIKVVI